MARTSRLRFRRLILSSALLSLAVAASATQYTIQALDPSVGVPYSINELGQTAGNLLGANFQWDAYADFGSGPQSIGRIPGDSNGIVTQMNNHGMASGLGRKVDSSDPYNTSKWRTHGFVYQNGTLIPVGTLAGDSESQMIGINDSGFAVGWSGSGEIRHAIGWKNGAMVSLGALPGDDESTAFGVDEKGDAVGVSRKTNGSHKAVLFHDGEVTALPQLAHTSSAYWVRISRNGTMVGVSNGFFTSSQGYRSWIISNGQAIDLGTLAGSNYMFAQAVNDSGVVVGYSDNLGYRAFVYDGAMHDLNDLIAPSTPGWLINVAYSVNNAGQIVGYGLLNGQSRAFIATPVPEPGTLAILGAGAVAMLRRRRKNSLDQCPAGRHLAGSKATRSCRPTRCEN